MTDSETIDELRDTVPPELKALNQWVIWRERKIPYQARFPDRNAKTDTPSTWAPFDCAVNAYHQGKAAGIGFVFTEKDPYCGIDLDNCLKPDQTPKQWATPIMADLMLVGYGEISPSGTGVKYWTRAVLGAGRNTTVGDGKIEIYDRTRYFTVTGNQGCGSIDDGSDIVADILKRYFPSDRNTQKSTPTPGTDVLPPSQSTREIIDRIRQSRQSVKFDKLFRGDWSDYRAGNEGASRADQALCSIVAFYTRHPATIDAVFQQSGLMRPKWNEKHAADGRTYGQMTIDFALANTTSKRRTSYTRTRRRHSTGGYRHATGRYTRR